MHRLKVKGCKQHFMKVKIKKKKAEVAIVISDKINFKTKTIIRNKK